MVVVLKCKKELNICLTLFFYLKTLSLVFKIRLPINFEKIGISIDNKTDASNVLIFIMSLLFKIKTPMINEIIIKMIAIEILATLYFNFGKNLVTTIGKASYGANP